MTNGHILAHVHRRKTKYTELFPHRAGFKKWLDKSIYIIAIASPLMTLPQVWKIWAEHATAGLALSTWVTYLITAIIWTMYGFAHKEKPIIVTNILWVIMDIAIVIGILIY